MKKIKTGGIGGFVLIELLISMSLATLILGVVLFGYRVFTNNLAIRAAGQQIAVSVRQAQTQGVVNRQINTSADFANGYGVSFNLSDPTSYIVFVDKNGNGKCDGSVATPTDCSSGTEVIEKDSFKNNVSLYSFCGTDPSNTMTCPPLSAQNLNVIFSSTNQEKASDAKIQFTDALGNVLSTSYTSAQIFVGIGGQAPFSEVSVSSTGVIYLSSASTVPTTNHPPVITLIGANPMTVTTGSTFTDPGATASDIEDGDLTSSITTTGHVNTLVAGTYTLTYNVTDSGGLSATPVMRTVNVNPSCVASFVALGQTSRNWVGMAVDSSNHNVYASVYDIHAGDDIYKQTGGTGNFVALGQVKANWRGVAVDSSNQNVYAVVQDGDIYKQTGGTGNFVALGQTSRMWYGIAVDSTTHDVYAVDAHTRNGIYKQTGGTGDFVFLSTGITAGAFGWLPSWFGIAVDSSNQNIYVVNAGGDIYKQTGGTGNFVALGQAKKDWYGISVDSSNHNVYAELFGGDIYKYTPCP